MEQLVAFDVLVFVNDLGAVVQGATFVGWQFVCSYAHRALIYLPIEVSCHDVDNLLELIDKAGLNIWLC